MTLTIANSNIVFPKFEAGFQEYLNQEAKLFKTFTKKPWPGGLREGRLHYKRSGALRWGEDGSAYPTPGRQGYKTWKHGRAFLYGSLELTHGIMQIAKGTKNLAVEAVKSEVMGLTTEAEEWLNMFFYGDGSGKVATIQDATGLTAGAISSVTVEFDDVRFLYEGVTYEIRDGTTGALNGTVTLDSAPAVALTSGDATAVLSGTVTADAAVGDYLVPEGSYGRAINGLEALIDDTSTIQGVVPANVPTFRSIVLGNGGTNRPLEPYLIRQLLAGMVMRSGLSGGANGLKACGTAWLQSEFDEMYEGDFRYSASDSTVGTSVTKVQTGLGALELDYDTKAPFNKLFVFDPSVIEVWEQRPLGFVKREDGIFGHSLEVAKGKATMEWIGNPFITDRRKAGKIEDIETDRNIAY